MVGTYIKLTLDCSIYEHLNVIVSHVDNINESIQIIFDLIEVPVVRFSNFWWNISLTYPVDVLG